MALPLQSPLEPAPAAPAPPGSLAPLVRQTQPEPPVAALEPLGALPADWAVVEHVTAGHEIVDLAVVGPNGVFAVSLDDDPSPGAVRPLIGLVKAGSRDPEPVKRALRAATALRRRLAHLPRDVFPYPVLISTVPGEAGHRLARLLVVRPGRFAEAVWRHPSRPLRRSERAAILDALRTPA